MEHRWAVERATGRLVYGGSEPYDVAGGLSPTQDRVVFARAPNPTAERYDASIPGLRASTPAEIDADAQARLLTLATTTSRQKDILSTIALAIRLRNVAAWNALPPPQKIATVLAEADNWRDIRAFIEDRL